MITKHVLKVKWKSHYIAQNKPVIRNCLQTFETVRAYKVEDTMCVPLQVYVCFSCTTFHISVVYHLSIQDSWEFGGLWYILCTIIVLIVAWTIIYNFCWNTGSYLSLVFLIPCLSDLEICDGRGIEPQCLIQPQAAVHPETIWPLCVNMEGSVLLEE